jgi:electron transport complex protein RnfB
MSKSRRKFIQMAGHALGGAALIGAGARILSPADEDAVFIPQARRFTWQIDPEKCLYCGICETACVRKPSAVKAVNDQKKCSNCVVCYGHISDSTIASEKIDSEGKRICPYNAVKRKNFCGGLDGMYLYTQDPALCTGCGKCVEACNVHGSESMFLIIRPDLCLGCNECAIAVACPHDAIERIPCESVDDFRGFYGMEELMMMEESG